MVYVVRQSDQKVLNRMDAWVFNSVELMRNWVIDNGMDIIREEITIMGNMVIWVE